MSADLIGNIEVAVLVPSKYGSLKPIPEGRRESAILKVKKELSQLFGGASRPTNRELDGAFKDPDGGITVHEPVSKIYATVDSDAFTSSEKKHDLMNFASSLCTSLSQCCIGVQWGRELYFVYGQEGAPAPVSFRQLPPHYRKRTTKCSLVSICLPRGVPCRSVSATDFH